MPITPKYLMKRFFCHIEWKIPGAVPCPNPPPNLPAVHSIHIKGIPRKIKEIKYGIINAPPPFCAAWTGKRKKFPSPTAEPATARIIPALVFQVSRNLLTFAIFISSLCGFHVDQHVKIRKFSLYISFQMVAYLMSLLDTNFPRQYKMEISLFFASFSYYG